MPGSSAYGDEAILCEVPKPDGLPDPGSGSYFPPSTLENRYMWCRGLTAMRQAQLDGLPRRHGNGEAVAGASARVALGGKLAGSLSCMPGVLEEIVLTLRANRPLYLIGSFGGAARLVADVLTGHEREELSTTWFENHHLPENGDVSWGALIARYQQDDITLDTPEELADELAKYADQGLEASLNNGLTGRENRELFACDDPQRAVGLILHGLRNRYA